MAPGRLAGTYRIAATLVEGAHGGVELFDGQRHGGRRNERPIRLKTLRGPPRSSNTAKAPSMQRVGAGGRSAASAHKAGGSADEERGVKAMAGQVGGGGGEQRCGGAAGDGRRAVGGGRWARQVQEKGAMGWLGGRLGRRMWWWERR